MANRNLLWLPGVCENVVAFIASDSDGPPLMYEAAFDGKDEAEPWVANFDGVRLARGDLLTCLEACQKHEVEESRAEED